MQLHRLAAIFLVVGILAGPCLAQPPLALVGTVEFVCAPENAANLPATCPGLPSSHPAKYGGSLPENPLPAPRGFETFSMIEAHEDERGDGYYIFGEERGSGHAPYLAFSTKAQINNSENWEIFVGRGISGSVAWVSQDVWQNQQTRRGPMEAAGQDESFCAGQSLRRFSS